MADYRAGIVGCGHIARVHAGGFRATGGVDLVAAADIVPGALDAFGEEWGVEGRYTDCAEMLAQEKLDILSVCTRNHQHVEPTLAGAEAGAARHLLRKADGDESGRGRQHGRGL